ncbi:unnamed protein product [Acanthosepion pharaonis]|uniref:Uncharacterized protein n=1 Tax=Acanthosepion pharaonis TaxID=158019 RepID=A0A812EPZ9_ACAPH|nr:unnamed protein product [Sepia pharaonis]
MVSPFLFLHPFSHFLSLCSFFFLFSLSPCPPYLLTDASDSLLFVPSSIYFFFCSSPHLSHFFLFSLVAMFTSQQTFLFSLIHLVSFFYFSLYINDLSVFLFLVCHYFFFSFLVFPVPLFTFYYFFVPLLFFFFFFFRSLSLSLLPIAIISFSALSLLK